MDKDYRREMFISLLAKPPLKNMTAQEIAIAIGVATNRIFEWKSGRSAPSRKNLQALEKLSSGTLTPPPGLMPVPQEHFSLPLLGEVRGGDLTAALEETDEFIKSSYKPGNHFALRVQGDSMIGAGITQGAIVTVRIQQDATDGDIVVARCEEETTIKYFRKLKDGIFLVPANDKFKAIPFKGCKIIGKVVEARRKY